MPQKHPKRAVKQQTVAQALHNRRWVSDIKGALTVEVLVEYLQIWDLVDDFNLHQDIPIIISGGLRGLVLIQANQPTGHFLLGPSFLHLGSGFGNLGALSVANSLFGWQLRAAVGQLTALQKEDFLTVCLPPM